MEPGLDHDVVLRFLAQLALLLACTRMGAELAARLAQPPVVGELAAGIALGPTGLGHVAPALFSRVFPAGEAMRLLESVSWLGMVFLMLLTGLETDLRLLRHLGRAAAGVSLGGMVVPFMAGGALALMLPPRFVPSGVERALFALFLATAMSISAMPVISRILVELGLVHRDLGLLSLSAGVVDDATGWLLLSLIAGIAREGSGAARGLVVALSLGAYLLLVRWIGYPLVSRLLRWIDDEWRLEGSDLAACVVAALASAAVTQAIGVHAVFGAFVAGVVLRQVPRLRPETVERMENSALSAFSPIFFAFVGLRADLWRIPGPGLAFLFLGVATIGKLAGCFAGGLLGGLGRWESLALGVAMNARGAMELVVATLGLSLGILDARMFSLLVLVALVTSMVTPIVLAKVAARVPPTRAETARIERRQAAGIQLSSAKIVTGSDEAIAGARALDFALLLAAEPDATVVALHRAADGGGFMTRLRGGARAQLERLHEAGRAGPGKVTFRAVRGPVSEHLAREAKGAALAILGATSWPRSFSPRAYEGAGAVAVLRPKRGGKSRYVHLLVPTDGSAGSRASVELALAYAAATGARVTVLHVMERPLANPLLPHRGLPVDSARRLVETTLNKSLAPLLEALEPSTRPSVHVQVLEGAQVNAVIVRETELGPYDLLVVHATGKAVGDGTFLGYGMEFLVEEAACSVLCVFSPGAA